MSEPTFNNYGKGFNKLINYLAYLCSSLPPAEKEGILTKTYETVKVYSRYESYLNPSYKEHYIWKNDN